MQSVSICKQTNEPNNKQRTKIMDKKTPHSPPRLFCNPQRARSALSDVNYEKQKRCTYARLPVHRRMVHFSFHNGALIRYDMVRYACCGELEGREWCEQIPFLCTLWQDMKKRRMVMHISRPQTASAPTTHLYNVSKEEEKVESTTV